MQLFIIPKLAYSRLLRLIGILELAILILALQFLFKSNSYFCVVSA